MQTRPRNRFDNPQRFQKSCFCNLHRSKNTVEFWAGRNEGNITGEYSGNGCRELPQGPIPFGWTKKKLFARIKCFPCKWKWWTECEWSREFQLVSHLFVWTLRGNIPCDHSLRKFPWCFSTFRVFKNTRQRWLKGKGEKGQINRRKQPWF